MSEYKTVGLKSADIDAVDWDAAEAIIDRLEPEATEHGDGYSLNLMTSKVAGWREELLRQPEYVPDNDSGTRDLLTLLPDRKSGALDRPLDAAESDALKALLKADLRRVRDLATRTGSEQIEEGYECYGELDVLGTARVMRMRVDMRNFENAIDGPYYSLERLVDLGVLAAIPGVEQIEEI